MYIYLIVYKSVIKGKMDPDPTHQIFRHLNVIKVYTALHGYFEFFLTPVTGNVNPNSIGGGAKYAMRRKI